MKRKKAIELGLKKYMGDTKCLRNHPPERYTRTGTCICCDKLRYTKMKAKHLYGIRERETNMTRIEAWLKPDDAKIVQTMIDAFLLAYELEGQ